MQNGVKIYVSPRKPLGQILCNDDFIGEFSKGGSESKFLLVGNLIQKRMRVKTLESYSKYLGLPTSFGRYEKVVFSLIQDRVWKKMKDRKKKKLPSFF